MLISRSPLLSVSPFSVFPLLSCLTPTYPALPFSFFLIKSLQSYILILFLPCRPSTNHVCLLSDKAQSSLTRVTNLSLNTNCDIAPWFSSLLTISSLLKGLFLYPLLASWTCYGVLSNTPTGRLFEALNISIGIEYKKQGITGQRTFLSWPNGDWCILAGDKEPRGSQHAGTLTKPILNYEFHHTTRWWWSRGRNVINFTAREWTKKYPWRIPNVSTTWDMHACL